MILMPSQFDDDIDRLNIQISLQSIELAILPLNAASKLADRIFLVMGGVLCSETIRLRHPFLLIARIC